MKYIYLILFAVAFTSCKQEKAKIQVKNNVHNVRLESISWGEESFGTLITGETSSKLEIIENKESFPMEYQIEFYMEADDNMVYLKTKESYELNPGDDLLITIDDNTEVINPAL